MKYENMYKDKCVSAEVALKNIAPNSRVVMAHCIGEPMALIDVMMENKQWFKNVEIVHMVPMGKSEYVLPGMQENFWHNSFFVGGTTREAVNTGRADFTPCFFHELPGLLRSEDFKVDVALVQVSPPDKFGYVNLGLSADYTVAAVETADIVIAQVNKFSPVTHGDTFVHINDIDYFVEMDAPLKELALAKITDVEMQIGKHCATLIEDGSTLQLGIGSLPDAVLMALTEKNDLGIHSEMISDGVIDLIERGNINNKKKTLHKGKSVVSFLMGTKRLYDFVDRNPGIEMLGVDYVNDPYVIRQNYKMISVNSCVQVDFFGQVVSESVGSKQISAVGGQVDFVRGTNMAKDGKSIIAISSTASGGKFSKIVPFLDHGAAVTTSRYDVNYIVTEYGIAKLKGQTLRERARRLINIAHPSFRPSLIEEWEKRFSCEF